MQQPLRLSGAVAVGVTTVTILLATLVSPTFHWRENALSNLGVAETAAGTELTAVLFNGGLVLGGIAGVGFGILLALTTPTTGGRVVGALFGLVMVLMGAVGVFPQDRALHLPVAMGFYLLLSIALWADAAVALGHGWRRRALVGFVSGAVNLLGWIGWASTGPVQRPGLAIPEGIGALALAVWTLWVTVGLVRGRWGDTSNA